MSAFDFLTKQMPHEWLREKLKPKSTGMRFEVGEGLTPEQKQEAEKVVRKEPVKKGNAFDFLANIGRALPQTKTPFGAIEKTISPARKFLTELPEIKESFIKGLDRGWLLSGSALESIASVGAKKVGFDEISEKLKTLSIKDRELASAGVNVIDTRKFGEKIKDPLWIAEGIGQNIPNMFIGMGAAVPVAVAGAGALAVGGTAFLATATLEGGFAYNDALDFGVSEEEAEKVAGLVGVANGLLEAMPITKLLTRTPVGTKIKRSLIREITKRTVQQTVLESGTESLQEVVSNAVATTYDENRDLLEGVPESAFFGAIMGGGMSTVMDVGGRIKPGLTIEDVSKSSDKFLEAMRKPKVVKDSYGSISPTTSGKFTAYDPVRKERLYVPKKGTTIKYFDTKEEAQIALNKLQESRLLKPTTQAKPLPKPSPLIQEAKKYKSADEFVRNYDGGLILNRGKVNNWISGGPENTAPISELLGPTGKKFMKDMNLPDIPVRVQEASEETIGHYAQIEWRGGNRLKDARINIEISPTEEFGIESLGEMEKNLLHELAHAKQITLNRLGGKKVQSEISEISAEKHANYILKQTKSQLTDIWKEAQVAPAPKIAPKEALKAKEGIKTITPKMVKEFVGDVPSEFINVKKRETTLLKDRIKKIQKSALSEVNKKAKIQQLKNEFQVRLEKAVRKEQLKTIKVGITERIKGIAKGVRESRVLTKNEIEANQTEIIDILDKSNLERDDKAKFIRAIKNVQTTEQLKKALPAIQERIETLSEQADKKRYIEAIQKAIKTTVVKGKKPKGKYTPEIQNVLNSIKKLTDLNQKNATAKIESNLKEYAVKMPVEIAVENRILSLYTGTSSQVKELLDIINQLKEKGEVASSLKKFNIQSDIEMKSNLVTDRVTGGKGIEDGRLHGEPADKTKIQIVKQYLKAVGKKTILDWRGLMTTLDFNSSVKVKPLADIFSVSKNESKYKELQSKYIENFNEAVSSIYEVKNKQNSIFKVVNKITTEKVKVGEYEMTRDELIKRYMEIQDPTLIDSFERGNKYTEKTFEDIRNISEKDKKFAEWQLDYYQKLYGKVNEIYSTMNGVDLPFNEFYSPIRRVGYKVEPGHTEFMDEAFYRKAVTSKSLISRVKNINPILKQGSLSVLDRHITDTNYYIAWSEKIRELDSVFTNNEVREAIKQELPSSLLEAINTKILHLSTHGNKTASRIGWVDALRKSYVVGNLAVKPALTIKQLVSTLAYYEKISAKDLAVGILDFARNPVKNYQTLQNESAFIKMRGAGMERDIRDAIKEGVFDRYNKRQNLANTLLLNIRLGDKGAIVLGSWAMRRSRLKAGVKLDDVISEYEEFSADTQQSADISRLSEIQLGGSLEKLFTIFKSSQRAYLQKEVNAIKSMFRKDGFGKENVKRVAKVMFIYHIILPVVFQWVANMGGWDEDDIKDYKRAGLLGSLNGLFVAGDVIDGVLRGAMGMMVWDIESPIADIGDDINKIISNLTEEDVDMEDIQTALDAFASASTSVSGLPIEYSYDILESLHNENYDTMIKQILGWSEYVIGEEKSGMDLELDLDLDLGMDLDIDLDLNL